MVQRFRQQTRVYYLGGSSTWDGPGSLSGTWSPANVVDECTDVVDGTRNPHPMVIEHRHSVLWSVSGRSRPASQNGWLYNGHVVTATPVVTPAQGEPTDNTALSKGLARTNPNRPKVDLLVGFIELKDLPRMLKSAWDFALTVANGGRGLTGKRTLRRAASDNLEWQFGWGPLISDLCKLLEFQAHTEKKLKVLRRLRERGSIGGKAVVWEDVVESAVGNRYATGLYQENNRFDFCWETTRRKWVTCIWRPTTPIPSETDAAAQNLAYRLAFGLDISPAAMWELMPWSWLIDWFSNVGEVMSLTRNTIPVSHSGSCIMTHTATKAKVLRKTAGTGSPSLMIPSVPAFERKVRTIMGDATPLPEFNLPFLNGKQLGILGSLAITRTVR